MFDFLNALEHVFGKHNVIVIEKPEDLPSIPECPHCKNPINAHAYECTGGDPLCSCGRHLRNCTKWMSTGNPHGDRWDNMKVAEPTRYEPDPELAGGQEAGRCLHCGDTFLQGHRSGTYECINQPK